MKPCRASTVRTSRSFAGLVYVRIKKQIMTNLVSGDDCDLERLATQSLNYRN